jgi:hypothetical protein
MSTSVSSCSRSNSAIMVKKTYAPSDMCLDWIHGRCLRPKCRYPHVDCRSNNNVIYAEVSIIAVVLALVADLTATANPVRTSGSPIEDSAACYLCPRQDHSTASIRQPRVYPWSMRRDSCIGITSISPPTFRRTQWKLRQLPEKEAWVAATSCSFDPYSLNVRWSNTNQTASVLHDSDCVGAHKSPPWARL